MRRLAALLVALALAGCSKSADQTVHDAASSQPAKAARDSFLAAAVKARITTIDLDSAGSVHVRAQGGSVTISGVVHDMAVKAAMLKAAQEIPGVEVLHDEIAVNAAAPRASKDIGDVMLGARVAAAIAGQTGVNALKVHVRAHVGTVTLEGSAPSVAIKETIVATARSVPDVHQVVDHIHVIP